VSHVVSRMGHLIGDRIVEKFPVRTIRAVGVERRSPMSNGGSE
jgi:hypothetical protein